MTDLSDTIESNASNPKQASSDGTSAQQHSLTEQIAADRYLKAGDAAHSKKRGLTLGRLRNQGTVST